MGLEYISQPQVFLAPISALGGIEGYINVVLDTVNLTASNISAENIIYSPELITDNLVTVDVQATNVNTVDIRSDAIETNNIIAYNYFLIPNTSVRQAVSSLALPTTTSDIELTANNPVTITNFTNTTKGVTYTLTNKSSHMVTVSSSPTVFVRNGTAWRSNTVTLSSAYLELPYRSSCCLRADNTFVTVW
jgi:hypothetical protein